MGVHVAHTIGDLKSDMLKIPRMVPGDARKVVREGARVGNIEARDNARRSSGKHGKHYPKAFTSEMKVHGLGGLYAAEYGPEADRPQGGMSFEKGSRNQPPHNDLARSADVVGPAFYGEVRKLPDRWFWPES